jgi:methylenetetrahydrofolate reductase (NADPH)
MISVELVPRSRASVGADLDLLERELPAIGMVNIPDLLRFSLRSWEACSLAVGRFERVVPHLRAMDHRVEDAGRLASTLRDLGIGEALVVRGDSPQDLARPVHATTSAEFIRALHDVDPNLRLYAAFDPYRQGLRSELDSVQEKLAAGASGLFTQPFFDLRLIQICADSLPGTDIFWGVSPVMTAGSRRYWEVKNRAVFPSEFEPTMQWNRAFAARCLEWARDTETNVYFMPIRIDLSEYMTGLL